MLGEIFRRETQKEMDYGTTGFRSDSGEIRDIAHRAYLVALLRSSNLGAPVGIIFTASHNPAPDNGIKFIDANGNMFDEEWETMSNKIVNAKNQELDSLVSGFRTDRSVVVLARDTRVSGEEMVQKCKAASDRMPSHHFLVDLGIATTPQIHFFIRYLSHQRKKSGGAPQYTDPCAFSADFGLVYGEAMKVYYGRIQRYLQIVRRVAGQQKKESRMLDTANGVGSVFFPQIRDCVADTVDLDLVRNTKELNEECGADYIKRTGQIPAGVSDTAPEAHKAAVHIDSSQNQAENSGKIICAFDGDCDRIVYFDTFSRRVIDGDRLCVLFCSFLSRLLTAAEIPVVIVSVVTAYSNGAAMDVLRKKGALVVGQTGVKNMQRRAKEHPVSVWFESNGHGTVVFSAQIQEQILDKVGRTPHQNILDVPAKDLDAEMDRILGASESAGQAEGLGLPQISKQQALLLLSAVLSVFDPFIGDAFVNMAVAESIFSSGFFPVRSLIDAYKDLPAVLLGVRADKTKVDEVLLQAVQSKYPDVRVHLRPSGTEDLIRVYVEGENEEKVKSTADQIRKSLQE